MAKGLVTGTLTKAQKELLEMISSGFQGTPTFLKQQNCHYCHEPFNPISTVDDDSAGVIKNGHLDILKISGCWSYDVIGHYSIGYCPMCGRKLEE